MRLIAVDSVAQCCRLVQSEAKPNSQLLTKSFTILYNLTPISINLPRANIRMNARKAPIASLFYITMLHRVVITNQWG